MTNLTVPDGFMAARAALAEAGVVLMFVRRSLERGSVEPPGGWERNDP
jgi:hypothetical protein